MFTFIYLFNHIFLILDQLFLSHELFKSKISVSDIIIREKQCKINLINVNIFKKRKNKYMES